MILKKGVHKRFVYIMHDRCGLDKHLDKSKTVKD